jgi:hypothetical protein
MTSKLARLFSVTSFLFVAILVSSNLVVAQENYPADNGYAEYHRAPDYRQSESHPLRVVGYILHPIGWVMREVIFRPFSWLASSSEETRSVMGYRDPRDFRSSNCFDTSGDVPNCRGVAPFNYGEDKK